MVSSLGCLDKEVQTMLPGCDNCCLVLDMDDNDLRKSNTSLTTVCSSMPIEARIESPLPSPSPVWPPPMVNAGELNTLQKDHRTKQAREDNKNLLICCPESGRQ